MKSTCVFLGLMATGGLLVSGQDTDVSQQRIIVVSKNKARLAEVDKKPEAKKYENLHEVFVDPVGFFNFYGNKMVEDAGGYTNLDDRQRLFVDYCCRDQTKLAGVERGNMEYELGGIELGYSIFGETVDSIVENLENTGDRTDIIKHQFKAVKHFMLPFINMHEDLYGDKKPSYAISQEDVFDIAALLGNNWDLGSKSESYDVQIDRRIARAQEILDRTGLKSKAENAYFDKTDFSEFDKDIVGQNYRGFLDVLEHTMDRLPLAFSTVQRISFDKDRIRSSNDFGDIHYTKNVVDKVLVAEQIEKSGQDLSGITDMSPEAIVRLQVNNLVNTMIHELGHGTDLSPERYFDLFHPLDTLKYAKIYSEMYRDFHKFADTVELSEISKWFEEPDGIETFGIDELLNQNDLDTLSGEMTYIDTLGEYLKKTSVDQTTDVNVSNNLGVDVQRNALVSIGKPRVGTDSIVASSSPDLSEKIISKSETDALVTRAQNVLGKEQSEELSKETRNILKTKSQYILQTFIHIHQGLLSGKYSKDSITIKSIYESLRQMVYDKLAHCMVGPEMYLSLPRGIILDLEEDINVFEAKVISAAKKQRQINPEKYNVNISDFIDNFRGHVLDAVNMRAKMWGSPNGASIYSEIAKYAAQVFGL